MFVCTFPNEFLNGLMGGDWRLLARSLVSDDSPYLPTKMKAFAAQMADRKRRPSTAQIGLLVGLFIIINVQQTLKEREASPAREPTEDEAKESAGSARIIPFPPGRRRSSGSRYAAPDSAA